LGVGWVYATPQLPPVLRAPCDEALVLLSLLCACLVLRCVLATPTPCR